LDVDNIASTRWSNITPESAETIIKKSKNTEEEANANNTLASLDTHTQTLYKKFPTQKKIAE
tara:strand:+ start:812 stop:997 length:186 start_codon:yes stop_codon:yes gene_type:complete